MSHQPPVYAAQGQSSPPQQQYTQQPSHYGAPAPQQQQQQQQYPPQQQGYPQQYPPQQQQGYPPQQQQQSHYGAPPPQQQQQYSQGQPQAMYIVNPGPPAQQWSPPPKPDPNGPPPVIYVVYDANAVKSYTRQWKIGMGEACCVEPCNCLYGCACGCCFAHKQREQIMGHPQAVYRCCLASPGPWYCCGCELPRCCLWWEVCCCLPAAVYANRVWIQMNYHITNSCCDTCLMCIACCAGCICYLVFRNRDMGRLAANLVRCSVLGCMLTQQQYELDHIYDEFQAPKQQTMQ